MQDLLGDEERGRESKREVTERDLLYVIMMMIMIMIMTARSDMRGYHGLLLPGTDTQTKRHSSDQVNT